MFTFDSVAEDLRSYPIVEFTATSLGEFCNLVEYITEAWRRTVADRQLRLDQPAPFNYGELSPWFRGLSNEDYACEPSLFRFHQELREFQGVDKPTIYEMEDYFLQRFKAFGPPMLEDSVPKSKLEWNFLMRNHGVPSRLLDWSKGSFIALYFATKKSLSLEMSEPESERLEPTIKNSAVWMLEPRRLNEISGYMRDLFRDDYEIFSEEYFPETIDVRNINKLYPLPLIPNLISSRIKAHIGRFTLHSFKDGGLARFAHSAFNLDASHGNKTAYLVKIKIPTENHFKICRSLRSTGISDMNFTQDLDGLIGELKLRVILGREDHNKFAKEKGIEMEANINSAENINLLHDEDPQVNCRRPSQTAVRDKIFISYSHKDQEWLNDLKTHLQPYITNNKKLSVWEDTQIEPGAEWRQAIDQAIASAKLAVLLVSPDFLASNFIDTDHLPPLLDAEKNEDLIIYWVPIRPSSYKITNIARYEAAHSPEQPLSSLSPPERDQAWVKICETLQERFMNS